MDRLRLGYRALRARWVTRTPRAPFLDGMGTWSGRLDFRRWSLVLGVVLILWTVGGGHPAGAAGVQGVVGSPLGYLAVDPVRRWEIDVTYRLHRLEQEESSLVHGYQWRAREESQELAVAVRTRLGKRSIGLFRMPVRQWRLQGRGWQAGPTGWTPLERRAERLQLHPVAFGWRQETDWLTPRDVEWGADMVLGGGAGWAIIPQARWIWLRDPVILGVEVGVPWRFSRQGRAVADASRFGVTVDHAVNSRVVVSGGLAVEGDQPTLLSGWSVQVRPGAYWSVQVEWPTGTREYRVQTGWRLRM